MTTFHTRTQPDIPEPELLAAARRGDMEAYAELWRRYHRYAYATARSLTSTIDFDDVVAEAFARILQAFRNKTGPTLNFGAYLKQTLRSVVNRWGSLQAQAKEVPVDDFENILAEEPYSDHDERLTLRSVYRRLPPAWQSVLWLSEVQGHSSSELADILGVSVQAARALAYRARRGLREAWVAEGSVSQLALAA